MHRNDNRAKHDRGGHAKREQSKKSEHQHGIHGGVAIIDAKRRIGGDQIDIYVGACHSHDAEGDDESLRVSPREGSETQGKEIGEVRLGGPNGCLRLA